MKLTKLVPSVSTWASQALLSSLSDTWQSAQPRVSSLRTVCGKWALKAWLEKPSADTGACWK